MGIVLVLYGKNCRNTAEIAKTVGTTLSDIKEDALHIK